MKPESQLHSRLIDIAEVDLSFIPYETIPQHVQQQQPSDIHNNPHEHSINNQTMMKLIEVATTSQQYYHQRQQQKKHLMEKKYIWLFLSLLGFITGIISYTQDIIIQYMAKGRLTMINALDEERYHALRLFLWIVYNLVFVYVPVVLTVVVAPFNEGSGIAPVKAIINGHKWHGPLSFLTLVVKVLTLPAVLGANMFLGKEGPVIHIGALVAANLMNLRIFHPIKKVRSLFNQMLACGCVSSWIIKC